MYTLKIKWKRYANSENGDAYVADEATLFIPATEINVTRLIPAGDRPEVMKSWDDNDAHYMNLLTIGAGGLEHGGRMIMVRHDGTDTWYLASLAWLLGSDGKTIERVAP